MYLSVLYHPYNEPKRRSKNTLSKVVNSSFIDNLWELGRVTLYFGVKSLKTSIIILTLDQLPVTQHCLESIRKHTKEPYELIVVDNGSRDETVEYLKSQADVKTVLNPSNLGFAKGCNQGIEISTGENVLFLNNDTVVTENWLGNMLRLLYSSPEIGMVGPVSNYVSGHQQISVPYKDMSELDDFARGYCASNEGCWKRVFRLVGFCLLVKKQVLDDIGVFDEMFGMGNWEDDDLCLRAVNKGYNLRIALDSFVHHIGQVTFNSAQGANFHQQMQENKQKVIAKWGFDIAAYLYNLKADITISLCMIVRNEESVISRCLDTVKDIADEIIIVDTGSTDRTKEIISQYTDRIYDFPWIDDFAAARNYSFSKAKMEYILWLDADDVILEEDRKQFIQLKKSLDPSVDAVNMHYALAFDQYGNATFSLRRNRLLRRCRHFKWIGAVHEYLEVGGKILQTDIAITHKGTHDESDRNLRIYENRLAKGEEFGPRDLYYYANELLEHQQFDKAAEYYRKFLGLNAGWVEDQISACAKLADCYHTLGELAEERMAVLRSFTYDSPRAQFCCRLGYQEFQAGKYKQAVFWYKLATQLEVPKDSWGPIQHAAYTWLPHLQLCVCYDRLGQKELAYKHNEAARSYIPDDPSVLHNKKYLEDALRLTPLLPGVGKPLQKAYCS